jgi:prepilin peptidase CpaA
MIEAAILVTFPFAMAHAAVSDMLTMTIINRVSLLLIGAFAILAPMTGMDLVTIGWHAAAFLLVLSMGFILFAQNVMGGGDAKLMAATSLWFGFGHELVQYLGIVALIGGPLTILILSYRASPLSVMFGRYEFLRRIANPEEKVPYGIALGLGGLLAFPDSVLAEWVINRLTS